MHFFGDVDVICDIGGQDIKVLFMKNGDIANFRLSNSCSAGNGMLLQATADSFGVPVTQFADVAFKAELAPKFSYGCAVFLDTDRVNFQKEGYSKEEMLAGLAQVLPKNVWQYVVQIPRMAALGTKFVLQGGTQYNLAAVKAQVDYIKERVPGAEVFVHPHTGEAGAIGAAMETLRVVKRKGTSTFIGMDATINLEYRSKNDEETVCHFCPNECKRTFIDTTRPDGTTSRYIAGFSCEKGTVESNEAMLNLVAERKKLAQEFPNCVDYESKQAFRHFYKPLPMPSADTMIKDVEVKRGFLGTRVVNITRPFRRSSPESWAARRSVRIGIPRVLNLYSTGPFFRTYLEAIGIQRAERRLQRGDDRGDVGRGGQIRLRRPLLPVEGGAGAHPRAPLQGPHREEAAQVHLLPHPDAREQLRVRHDGQRELPHRGRRARRHEGGVHQGGRLLRDARHRVPRPVALVRGAEAHGAAPVRDVRPAPRHHRGRERPRRARGVEGAQRSSTSTCRRRGAPSSRPSRRRTASRSCSSGGPTTTTRG